MPSFDYDRDYDSHESRGPEPDHDKLRDDLLSGAYLPPLPGDEPPVVDFPHVMEKELLSINLRRAALTDPMTAQVVSNQIRACADSSLEGRDSSIRFLALHDPAAADAVVRRLGRELTERGEEHGFVARTRESFGRFLPRLVGPSAPTGRYLAAESLVLVARHVGADDAFTDTMPAIQMAALDQNLTDRIRVAAIHALLLADGRANYPHFETLLARREPALVRSAAHYARNAVDLMGRAEDRDEYFSRLVHGRTRP